MQTINDTTVDENLSEQSQYQPNINTTKNVRAKAKTKEEWQKLVDNFNPKAQHFRDYCQGQKIDIGTFKYWYYKLRSKELKFTKITEQVNTDKTDSRNNMFVGVKLLAPSSSIDKVKVFLPNGISLEVVTSDIIALIKELTNVV